MAQRRSKRRKSKGKQSAAAVSDADRNTEPPEIDREAELTSLLREYAEAELEATLSANLRDSAPHNDVSPTVFDSELEVSNRFPNWDDLQNWIRFRQYELRQEMGLGPPAMDENQGHLWDTIGENCKILKELQDGAAEISRSREALINALKGMLGAVGKRQWRGRNWTNDLEAVTAFRRLGIQNNVAQALETRYNQTRHEYSLLSRLAASKISVSRMLAEEVAIDAGVVLITEMEDLEDVYWCGGNEMALHHVTAQYQEAIDRWHHPDADSDETASAPNEPETPLRPEDYVVYTDTRSAASTQDAVHAVEASSSIPPNELVDMENLDWIRQQSEKDKDLLCSELEKLGLGRSPPDA